MRKLFQIPIALGAAFVFALAPVARAQSIYPVTKIDRIAEYTDGSIYIGWAGLPNPSNSGGGPCSGNNNGWVILQPTAPDSLKSLAFSVYFSGKPAQIRTSGCSGAYEIVNAIYTPGG